MVATILVVDDEKNIRRALRMVLEGSGFNAIEAASAEECFEQLASNEVDLVILDVRLPKMSGIEALAKIRSEPETRHLPVLMVSGHASVAEAVKAVQLGATDFFEKPLDRDRVLVTVRNALQTWQLQRELEQLRADVEQRYEMIGESPVMRSLFAQLEKVAPTNGRVLIFGESGTGKELIARAIHLLSPRANKPFIKVNCAAIPAELIESELFGYERGAFTGAQGRKKGMFELAVSRRDRRHERQRSGQSAARAPERRDLACRQRESDCGRRARACGDQQRPRARGQGRPLSRRPLLPAQRDTHREPPTPGAEE
jgi:two-component system nitrogen regulation response regulator NtrX